MENLWIGRPDCVSPYNGNKGVLVFIGYPGISESLQIIPVNSFRPLVFLWQDHRRANTYGKFNIDPNSYDPQQSKHGIKQLLRWENHPKTPRQGAHDRRPSLFCFLPSNFYRSFLFLGNKLF